MVERRIELDRRYHRKKKMRKLKKKLVTASGEERDKILYKIKRLSPWWTEAALTQAETGTAPAASRGERKRPATKKKS
jgi:hypothetical protein